MSPRHSLLLPRIGAPGGDLPVRDVLPGLVAALRSRGSAVLVAPPGSGKTSLLPLALADEWPGRVIVAEPRRIATRAAARRMAELVGEDVGGRIGYAMRGDRRVSGATRIEVVTTGLLLRRLQQDPELAGVDAVVIDEVHERALDTDLALAFCLDVISTIRPDLRLVATSATADSARLAELLRRGDPAPIVIADGSAHPVELIFAPAVVPTPLLADARVDPRLLDQVAAVVRRALAESTGDVLVFLPGEAEIASVASRLGARVDGAGPDVQRLYGRQSSADQDRVLQPSGRRRVVLATAVAESSLTVPGVSIVVDAGLSREPRMDHVRGLGALTTTKVSRSSAMQRAGRAGRQGPGRAYRCWSDAEDRHLPAHQLAEILTADLTGFALSVAEWGHPRGVGLELLDGPPPLAMDAAEATLESLEAVDDSGRITDRGRQLARIGAPPRLARALLDGTDLVGSDRAAQIVALLSADAGAAGDDLVAGWRSLRNGRDPAAGRWREEVRRLTAQLPTARGRTELDDDLAAGIVVGLAFPDRLARLRNAGGSASRSYLMTGGTGSQLAGSTGLTGSTWLAIASADRPSGRADARIRLAAPIDQPTALRIAKRLRRNEDEIHWGEGVLTLRRRDYLGAVPLTEQPLADPDPERVTAALAAGLRAEGLGILHIPATADTLRRRLALLHRVIGEPWPDMSDAGLLASVETWLGADLRKVRRSADVGRIDVTSALRRLLPWPTAARLDELVPERVPTPSGAPVRLDYGSVDHDGDGQVVLAIKVQQAFGLTSAPVIADGRVAVVMHLLSPAGRPAAITSDLASFWTNGYPQVRAELRSRYPRHAWPDDPCETGSVRQ